MRLRGRFRQDIKIQAEALSSVAFVLRRCGRVAQLQGEA